MLPHCDITGICQPIGLPYDGCESVVEITNVFLNSFWNSSFVYSFRSFTVKGIEIKNFPDWETKIKNPLDILDIDFIDEGYTINYFMNQYNNNTQRKFQVEKHLRVVMNTITNSIENNVDKLTNDIHDAAKQIMNHIESTLQSK